DERKQSTLPGQLWEVRNVVIFGAETDVRMLSDSNRPELFGVRIERPYYMHGPDDTNLVQTYWFDPGKDDLPCDWSEVYTDKASKQVVQEWNDKVLEFASTEDGHWYPSRWQSHTSMTTGKRTQLIDTDSRLQVWTGRKLDAQWFGDPAMNVH